MRRFFIENYSLKEKSAIIEGSDFKHIKNVLRLKKGDSVKLFNGKGLECYAIIAEIKETQILFTIIKEEKIDKESPVDITVAQAYLKDNKMNKIIRHLTELGIKRWIPFFSERTVPKSIEKRIDKKIVKWQKIAKESLKQCDRNNVMEIKRPIKFNEIFNEAEESNLKIVFWECESTPLKEIKTLSNKCKNKKIFIMFGPEGGFSKQEVDTAKKNGFITLSLGPRILKADTATIAGSSIIQYIFGDI